MLLTKFPSPEHPAGPVTLKCCYPSKNLWFTTEIERFAITKIQTLFGRLVLTYEVTGTVTGEEALSLDIKCYDADGFLLETVGVYHSVHEGERFCVTGDILIPGSSSRMEVITNGRAILEKAEAHK